MSKNYNLGSKSDMRKFTNDLERAVKEKSVQALHARKYDVDCPHCNGKVKVAPGKSNCPLCSKEIDLELNIT